MLPPDPGHRTPYQVLRSRSIHSNFFGHELDFVRVVGSQEKPALWHDSKSLHHIIVVVCIGRDLLAGRAVERGECEESNNIEVYIKSIIFMREECWVGMWSR